MSIGSFLSMYFLEARNGIFDNQRRFYQDRLNGEDLGRKLREVDSMESNYVILSKHVPNIVDLGAIAFSYFTGNPSYLFGLGIAEFWRNIEIRNEHLYNWYAKKMARENEKWIDEGEQGLIKSVSGREELESWERLDDWWKEPEKYLDED